MPELLEHQSFNDFTANELKKLHKFIRKNKLDKVLTVHPDEIKAHSYVGIIKCGKLQIEILPKLLSAENADKQTILTNLLYMLSFTKKLDINVSDSAIIDQCKNPFLEVLIREYATSLFAGLKRQTPKSYIQIAENLSFWKGKMKLGEHIRYNCCNKGKIYCEYDEFSEDNILNQLFYFIAECLYNITNSTQNKKLLQLIKNHYSDITFRCFDYARAQNIRLRRNQEIFAKPLKLAKMFLQNTMIDISHRRMENIVLLWDMNLLFEEFVFELIRRKCNCQKFGVKAQKRKKLLRTDNGKRRDTRIDIYFERGDDKIIIDTKYKEFRQLSDFSPQDVYQVSTYCLLHDAERAILIYPQWQQINDCMLCELNTDDENKHYKIRFKTINICQNIKENLPAIVDDLNNMLEVI